MPTFFGLASASTRGRPWSVPEATIAVPSTHSASAPSAPIASCGEPTGSVRPVRTLCVVHGVAGAGRSSTSTPERCVGARARRLGDDRRGRGGVGEREALERRRRRRQRRRERCREARRAPTRRCAATGAPGTDSSIQPSSTPPPARRRRDARRARGRRGRQRGAEGAADRPHRRAHAPVGDAPGGVGVAGRDRPRARRRSRPRRRVGSSGTSAPHTPAAERTAAYGRGTSPAAGPWPRKIRTALPSGSGARRSCWTSVTVGGQRRRRRRAPSRRRRRAPRSRSSSATARRRRRRARCRRRAARLRPP